MMETFQESGLIHIDFFVMNTFLKVCLSGHNFSPASTKDLIPKGHILYFSKVWSKATLTNLIKLTDNAG